MSQNYFNIFKSVSQAECEGACEEHIGYAREVHIVGPNGFDWGNFRYCEAAIAEDESMGLKVTLTAEAALKAARGET